MPMSHYSGDHLDRIKESIDKFSADSEKSSKTMTRLSWAMFGLALVQAIVGAAQVWLALGGNG